MGFCDGSLNVMLVEWDSVMFLSKQGGVEELFCGGSAPQCPCGAAGTLQTSLLFIRPWQSVCVCISHGALATLRHQANPKYSISPAVARVGGTC